MFHVKHKKIMLKISALLLAVMCCLSVGLSCFASIYIDNDVTSDCFNVLSVTIDGVDANKQGNLFQHIVVEYKPYIPTRWTPDGLLDDPPTNGYHMEVQAERSYYSNNINNVVDNKLANCKFQSFGLTKSANHDSYNAMLRCAMTVYPWGRSDESIVQNLDSWYYKYSRFTLQENDPRDLYFAVGGRFLNDCTVNVSMSCDVIYITNQTSETSGTSGRLSYLNVTNRRSYQAKGGEMYNYFIDFYDLLMSSSVGSSGATVSDLANGGIYQFSDYVIIENLSFGVSTSLGVNTVCTEVVVGMPISTQGLYVPEMLYYDVNEILDKADGQAQAAPVYIGSNIVDWIGPAVQGFFSMEIFGTPVTIGSLITLTLAVGFIFLILRYFGGG